MFIVYCLTSQHQGYKHNFKGSLTDGLTVKHKQTGRQACRQTDASTGENVPLMVKKPKQCYILLLLSSGALLKDSCCEKRYRNG